MLRYPLILLVLLIMAVLSCYGKPSQPLAQAAHKTLSSTTTPTTLPDSAGAVATSYYQALQAHEYTAAYAYLDPNATDTTTGQQLTLEVFTHIAQESEKTGGPISDFSVSAYPPLVVVTVSRNGGPYHVHLQVKQEDSAWKITSLDRI